LEKRSKKKAKAEGGSDLLDQVIRLTGIPAKTIKRELKTILDRKNIDVNHLTLDQLRSVVASYVREIMSGVLDRHREKKPEHT
jgi:hypothetical protein